MVACAHATMPRTRTCGRALSLRMLAVRAGSHDVCEPARARGDMAGRRLPARAADQFASGTAGPALAPVRAVACTFVRCMAGAATRRGGAHGFVMRAFASCAAIRPDQRAPAQMVEFPVRELVLLLALASAAHAAVDAQDRQDVSSPVDNQVRTESTALNATQEVAAATPCLAAMRVPPDPPVCRSRA